MSEGQRSEGGPGGDASGPVSPDRNARGGEADAVEGTQIADNTAAAEPVGSDPSSRPARGRSSRVTLAPQPPPLPMGKAATTHRQAAVG